MNNVNLNKNHTLVIFFLSLFFYLFDLNFDFKITSVICFFLIATIGVAHGALDHQKGKRVLKFFNIKKIEFFYISLYFLLSNNYFILDNFTNFYSSSFSMVWPPIILEKRTLCLKIGLIKFILTYFYYLKDCWL